MKTLRYYFALLLSLGLALGPVSTAHAGLESATYISDLNTSNPTAGDSVGQADDHIRLVKSAVKTTFPNISGAVTPTHTELNYVDGVTSAIQTQLDQSKVTNGTAASLTGTAVDFTSIPSWVKRITVTLTAASTNGTSLPLLQIGDSGGVEAASYTGTIWNNATATGAAISTGFNILQATAAATTFSATIVLTLHDASNTWVAQGSAALSSTNIHQMQGYKATSATLDRIRLTMANGTDAFDAGTANIQFD